MVDLLAFLPPSEFGGGPFSGFGGPGNDVWGWTDPVTGKEWAILGRADGTSFIDISSPTAPVLVADLPRHMTNALWSDVKVYADHAFIVKEGTGNGMQVFDLTRLRDIDASGGHVTVEADAHYGRFGNSHNVAINEDTGFAYAVGTTGAVPGQQPFVVTIDPPSSAAGSYQAAGANFGPDPSGAISGDVVLAEDGTGNNEGCQPFVGFPAGSIALVDRGTCGFVVKAANAQAAGAIALIVANNVAGAPFTMGGNDPSITIPSVMISMDDGATIKAGLPATASFDVNPNANPCTTGLHMVDIRDPLNPTFAGCYSEQGSTHDVQCVIYEGPDTRYQGREICFASNGGPDTLVVADVTDKSNPVTLSVTFEGEPNTFSHQGWLTEDHRYFLHNDESDNMLSQAPGRTRTRVFDVSDLENVSVQAVHHSETRASAHNNYVDGRYVFTTNYMDGLRIVDTTRIDHPGDEVAPETPELLDHQGLIEIGCFDTDPVRNDVPGFGGSWSNYPYFESGNVVVSGFDGLFVVKPKLGSRNPNPGGQPRTTGNPHTYGCLPWGTSG